MTPRETARSYDALASHWNGERFDRENGIAAHRRALQFLSRKRNAIDIGCGSSGRIIDLLLAEGLEVEGLDVSPQMIAHAKARHPDQEFVVADVCDWESRKSYDFISAWDSIWHVPLTAQEAVLEKLCATLTGGGVLIFTTGGVDRPEEKSDQCLGQPLYHAAPGIPQLLRIADRCDCICRHLEYDQFPELHLYLIFQKKAPRSEETE